MYTSTEAKKSLNTKTTIASRPQGWPAISLLSSPLPQYSPNASDGRDGPKTIKRGGIMYN